MESRRNGPQLSSRHDDDDESTSGDESTHVSKLQQVPDIFLPLLYVSM